ncbi:hypothetical protein QQY66_35125 [Streptomyces sp. DG2A-72]|uniref:hypothetical protein n=1 Tax=Streptomyces sp. DG2A-72 TaxID=3051386 RepID=UPI00265B84E8|nr:hypothetical protein [Streptomyces sp. DG2A-72]MDO0936693.1 hypothetical protein [Streptomyces sp. DG2A-72]
MAADPSPDLGEVLRQLAQVVGQREAECSFTDGHDRWSLYRAALDTPAVLPLLFDAVSLEPDGPLASGVVGDVLERVPEDEREQWVQILPRGVRDFSARRARELRVLASLEEGGVPADAAGELIGGWSDWLQLRAVRAASDKEVLHVVSQKGRTKAIRRAATEALQRR